MKCSDSAGHFSDAFDDLLPDRSKKEFFAHLEECGQCRGEYNGYSKSLVKLSSLQLLQAPEIERKVLAKMTEIGEREALTGELYEMPRRRVQYQFNLRQVAFTAAMFVGVFFAGYYLRSLVGPAVPLSIFDRLPTDGPAGNGGNPAGDVDNVKISTVARDEPCCCVPVDGSALSFKSLAYIMPEEELFSELYLMLQPIKLDENFKIFVMTGEPMAHKCASKDEMISSIAYIPAETGMKISPLMLATLKGSYFAAEIARCVCGACEHDFDYKSQYLFDYITSVVRKPRGFIVVIGDNIHSFIACRDENCLGSIFDYFIQSSYSDYNLLKSVEAINSFKFEPGGLRSLADRLRKIKEGSNLAYVWGVFSEVIVDPAAVSRAISSSGGAEAVLVNFPSGRLFSGGANLNTLRDASIYCRLARDHFHSLAKGAQSSVKKQLFKIYHSDPEGLAKKLVSALYIELAGGCDFSEKEFNIWADQ